MRWWRSWTGVWGKCSRAKPDRLGRPGCASRDPVASPFRGAPAAAPGARLRGADRRPGRRCAREADIVLVRRTSTRPPRFRGLWKDLTAWNVLEFKGPTVSPRRGDLERLIELGLGIHRRLNEERVQQSQPPVGAEEVSFWYLANRLGRRFLRLAREELALPDLESLGPGVWRCRMMRRLVFLVSGNHLP